MKARSYAVLWSRGEGVASGRLELPGDRIELHGRAPRLRIPLDEIGDVSIARGAADRLRGLPVLALRLRGGGLVRVASLEGAGALHELAARVAAAALRAPV